MRKHARGAAIVLPIALLAMLLLAACGGEKIIRETVVVEKPVEKIVQQTVLVEKQVPVEKIVQQTVVVEKQVPVEKVVKETVVVEKQVPVEKVVKETVVVEKIVVATAEAATPIPLPTPVKIDIPTPKSPADSLVMVIDDIGNCGGYQSAGAGTESAMHKGITETFFVVTDKTAEGPMLAKSWDLAPDLSGVTIRLQEGVQFHHDWGEMTSEDIVWNMNDANAGTNPLSIHGQAGDMNALFGSNPWEAIDKYTVHATFASFNPTWASRELNLGGESVAPTSKRAFDEKGEDWAKQNIIGTGPYQITSCVEDDRIVTQAVKNHWRKTANVGNITWMEIPEVDTKIAMLRTGEADMAEIPLARVTELAQQGFNVIPAGGRADEIGIMFGGNLWEDKHAITGEPLDRQPLNQAKKIPWLGHPDDPDDMEQARLVRWALAMAYDRDLINEQINGGLGWPTYVTMFSPTAPEWRDEWNVPYDPAKAEAYLDQAGFPRKANGTRFDIVLYGQPSPPVYASLAQAVAGFWDEIGVRTEVLTYSYSIIRPSLVQRTITHPFLKTCGESTSSAPWDWPRGVKMSSLSRGGFSCAQEAPEIVHNLLEASKEPDRLKRIEINNRTVAWMHKWAFAPGIVAVPKVVTINPKSIASWDMPKAFQASYRAPENIVPAR